MESAKKEILQEAKKIEADSIFFAKGHFHAAFFWSNMHFWIGIPTTIIAAITSAFALTQYHIVAGILAVLISILAGITTFINPNDKANSNFNSANSYGTLANNINIFINVDSIMETSELALVNKLKEFEVERDELNLNSPLIPKWALKKTRDCLKKGGLSDDFCIYGKNIDS